MSTAVPAIGDRIAGRYEVAGRIGEAPAYTALRVVDREAEVELALWWMRPELFPDDARRDAFVGAVVDVRGVIHPHLRRIFEAGRQGEGLYLTTQLSESEGSLLRLGTGRRAPEFELIRYASAVAEALDAAHQLGHLHGRLTPSDIVAVSGEIKVGGVGLYGDVELAAASRCWRDQSHYLAPEVRERGLVSPAADVYSLAALLAELATGMSTGNLTEVTQALSASHYKLADVLQTALALSPERRPQTISALLTRIRVILVDDRVPTAEQPAARPPSAGEDDPPTLELLLSKSRSSETVPIEDDEDLDGDQSAPMTPAPQGVLPEAPPVARVRPAATLIGPGEPVAPAPVRLSDSQSPTSPAVRPPTLPVSSLEQSEDDEVPTRSRLPTAPPPSRLDDGGRGRSPGTIPLDEDEHARLDREPTPPPPPPPADDEDEAPTRRSALPTAESDPLAPRMAAGSEPRDDRTASAPGRGSDITEPIDEDDHKLVDEEDRRVTDRYGTLHSGTPRGRKTEPGPLPPPPGAPRPRTSGAPAPAPAPAPARAPASGGDRDASASGSAATSDIESAGATASGEGEGDAIPSARDLEGTPRRGVSFGLILALLLLAGGATAGAVWWLRGGNIDGPTSTGTATGSAVVTGDDAGATEPDPSDAGTQTETQTATADARGAEVVDADDAGAATEIRDAATTASSDADAGTTAVAPDAAVVAPDAAVVAADAGAETGCPAGMGRVQGEETAVCVDRYEFPGFGQMPIKAVSPTEAAAMCAERKKRLCTEEEWEAACRGARGASFPYGPAYRLKNCNTSTGSPAALVATGSFPNCVSQTGIYDMAGNVAEWIADGPYTKGGSSMDGSDGRCSVKERRERERLEDVGFRCCANPEQ